MTDLHPAPEVHARPPLDGETPRGASSIVKLADKLGWRSRVTYARGTSIDQHGRPTRVVESLLVRAVLPGAGANVSAVWTDGKFELAYKWAPWLPATRIKSPELRAFLRGEG